MTGSQEVRRYRRNREELQAAVGVPVTKIHHMKFPKN